VTRKRPPNAPAAPKPAAPKSAAPARKGQPAWHLPAIIAVLVLGVAGVWWYTQHSGPEPIVKDLELSKQAAARAGEFVRQKRFREAQAAYREAVRYAPDDFWQLHFVLGATAAQISVENTLRAGISQPYSRSSVERVAAMREAIAEFEIAERLVDTPQGLANIYATRAETYFTWGQAWDALRYFDAASAADTTDRGLAERAANLRFLMSHPEGAKTLEEVMQAAKRAPR